MYWRDNQLHVALKTDSDISTVKANLASRGDSTVNNYVVVEPSQYSQTDTMQSMRTSATTTAKTKKLAQS